MGLIARLAPSNARIKRISASSRARLFAVAANRSRGIDDAWRLTALARLSRLQRDRAAARRGARGDAGGDGLARQSVLDPRRGPRRASDRRGRAARRGGPRGRRAARASSSPPGARRRPISRLPDGRRGRRAAAGAPDRRRRRASLRARTAIASRPTGSSSRRSAPTGGSILPRSRRFSPRRRGARRCSLCRAPTTRPA